MPSSYKAAQSNKGSRLHNPVVAKQSCNLEHLEIKVTTAPTRKIVTF